MEPPRKDLLCALGPASMNGQVIKRLEDIGETLYRINLTHTPADAVERTVRLIQNETDVPICLDTEVAQIRTDDLVDEEIRLHENSIVRAHQRRVVGEDGNFNFYPRDIVRALEVGDSSASILMEAPPGHRFEDEGTDAVAAMRLLNGGPVR